MQVFVHDTYQQRVGSILINRKNEDFRQGTNGNSDQREHLGEEGETGNWKEES